MKKNGKIVRDCINAYRETGEETDIMGSYTGVYRDVPYDGENYDTYDGLYNGNFEPIYSDRPMLSAYGSYFPCAESLSGKPLDDLVPVQDADDL